MKKKSYNTFIKTPFLTKPCPFCGCTKPQLQLYKYETGMIVKCPECWAITPLKLTWLSAVDAWENGEFSEITLELSEPREIDIHGALRLVEAVLEDAGNVYKHLLRKRETATTENDRLKWDRDVKRMEENFFKGDSIIKALPIDGEDAIKKLQHQVEKERQIESEAE